MRGVEESALHGSGDVGVGVWGLWKAQQQLKHMGLPEQLPAKWPMFVDDKQLRPHQIAAQIFFIEAAFTALYSEIRRGCLENDDVGLGKSAICLGLITYYITLQLLLKNGLRPAVLYEAITLHLFRLERFLYLHRKNENLSGTQN